MTRHTSADAAEGRLFVVATPIGNLGDLSDRARAALRQADRILCEDTRHTRKLLAVIGATGSLESFHEHNEDEKVEAVIRWIHEGRTIALVSDAGTPGLSDPGFTLLRRARELGIRVEPIPGPFAAAIALVASGLPPHPFAFWGFAPRKQGERRRFYERVRASGMTALVYEAPHRLVASLDTAREVLGDAEITVAREMTKMHEEFLHGTIARVVDDLRGRDTIRGEITIVIGPVATEADAIPGIEKLRHELENLTGDGLARAEAVRLLAERYGIRRNELYRILLQTEE